MELETMSNSDLRTLIEKCWMPYWLTHERHWKTGAIALGKELMSRIEK